MKPTILSAQILSEKRSIKAHLDQKAHSGKERLTVIFEELNKLANETDQLSLLRSIIYIVSALIAHRRFGGLSQPQLNNIVETAHGILGKMGVGSKPTALSVLYSDIHNALSQIYRFSGRHWRSAWEQQLALQWGAKFATGGAGYQAILQGNRALRLGNTNLALSWFRGARQHDLRPTDLGAARVGEIRTLRLMGNFEESKRYVENFLRADSRPGAHRELQWEKMLLDIHDKSDLRALMYATRKNGSHFCDSYPVESYLFAATSVKKELLNSHRRLKNIDRLPQFRFSQYGVFYKGALEIENCYDASIPLTYRIRDIGNILAELESEPNIDKVLLLFAAASRFLSRCKSFALAALVLGEYQSLSFSLSNGKNTDLLGTMSDLYQKKWAQTDGSPPLK
jgi:hypothetical protein